MYKILITFFVTLLLFVQVKAQVKTNFNNTLKVSETGKFNMAYKVSAFEINPPNLEAALQRDKLEESTNSKILYIAEPVAVKIDVVKLANWVQDGKYLYGKFTIKAPDAKTLSINFGNFKLPKGTEMYIYNKQAEMITGVITEAENNESKIWGSSIYKGEELNMEIKLPIEQKENLMLLLTNVAYGYKNIFVDKVAGFGTSGACNINVLCPQGNGWEAERNSVVYIARSNGDALCSGAMLMNTCSVNIPYILTANHCFQGDGNVAGWRFHFQAWSATCTPSQNSDGILFNGSTLRANWEPSDFCLVRLNQTPAANSGINYAGWDRRPNGSTSGASIHHPSGDVMKISRYFAPLQRLDNIGWNINGQTIFAPGTLHWRVQWPTATGQATGTATNGVTEGGSSGSPLFDQNRRVIGQLAGGPSSCAVNAVKQDHYGRFDNSWTGGGTNATRLSNWLDPLNTNVMTTNTTNINSLTSTNMNITLSQNGTSCNGDATLSVVGAPTGSSYSWTSSNYQIAYPANNSASTSIAVVGNGIVTITVTVTNPCYNTKTISTQFIAETQWSAATISNYIPFPEPSCYEANSFYFFQATSPQTNNLSQFQWGYRLQGSSTNIFVSSSSYIADFIFPQSGTYEIFVRPVTPCGLGNESTKNITVSDQCMGGGMFRSVVVSPNPANSQINIKTKTASSYKFKERKKIYIKLYEISSGKVAKSWETYHQEVINLNVADISSGTYILMMNDGEKSISTKVQITH